MPVTHHSGHGHKSWVFFKASLEFSSSAKCIPAPHANERVIARTLKGGQSPEPRLLPSQNPPPGLLAHPEPSPAMAVFTVCSDEGRISEALNGAG